MNNKLYIPTTTLNFDNILSSESISPKSFYSNRGFGFSRWFDVAENDNNNVILLYDKPMGFSRPVSDVEDHPLLIEVTLNERLKSLINKVDEGVYSCAETIYIDLWNTRFIFQSEREKQITLSLSDSSLETKVTRLYSKRMVVENLHGQYSLPKVSIKRDSVNTSAIEYDIEINKFKGLLYGYYIGAILSASKSNIEQLTLLKELRNVIAAVSSNIEGKPTSYQIDMIRTITSQLNSFDYHRQALKLIISNKTEYLKTIEYLISKNLLSNRFDGNAILQSLNTINYKKEVNNNDIIEFVNHQIETLNSRINQDCTPLNPDSGEIIVGDQKLYAINNQSFQSEEEKDLYKVWVNEIFISSQYNNKINYYKEALTDTLTIRAKELLQEQWDSSNTKVVMNKLRRHIRGESFDIEWNNGLISSLAAVVTNGENWGKLLSFMQQKGMYDYRLAFSIYGMLNGFANLTRDFTDIILNSDKHYVADVYKEFYGQLFGISVNIERNDNIAIDSKLNSYIKDNVSQVNKSDDDKILEDLKKADVVGKRLPKNLSKNDIYNNIMNTYIKHNRKWEFAFQDMIDDNNGITQAVIKRICGCLGMPNWKSKPQITKESNNKQTNKYNDYVKNNLFSYPINQYSENTPLWKDDKLWGYIQYEFDEKNRGQAYEDIIWFQEEFQKGELSKYYAKARRDNNSTIITLENYLSKFEQRRYMNEQTLRKVMGIIKSKYK